MDPDRIRELCRRAVNADSAEFHLILLELLNALDLYVNEDPRMVAPTVSPL